jgi:hypothetical protein
VEAQEDGTMIVFHQRKTRNGGVKEDVPISINTAMIVAVFPVVNFDGDEFTAITLAHADQDIWVTENYKAVHKLLSEII